MKVTVTFKDPDGVYESVRSAIEDSLDTVIDDYDREALRESREDKVKEQLGKWIEYGEYLCVEFDTEAGTATVKKAKP